MECPETLSTFTFSEIVTEFRIKYNSKSNFNYQRDSSIFGKVASVLTKTSKSTIDERKYLNLLWNEKIKDLLQNERNDAPNSRKMSSRIHKDRRDRNYRRSLDSSNLKTSDTTESQIHTRLIAAAIINIASNQTSSRNKKRAKSKENGRETLLGRLSQSFKRICLRSKSRRHISSNTDTVRNTTPVSNSQTVPSQSGNLEQNIVPPTPPPPPDDDGDGDDDGDDDDSDDNNEVPQNSPPSFLLDPQYLSIEAEYQRRLFVFPTAPCRICKRLMYNKSSCIKPYTFTETMVAEFRKYSCMDFNNGDSIRVCDRCKNKMKKTLIPPMAYFNNMDVPDSPICISLLTEIEARLLSQVKLFMKMYKRCKGRGQLALKGTCIHFPQKVDEIAEILPHNADTADIIIVTDTANKNTTFEVRARIVYEALSWLKMNNPWYHNIQVRHLPDQDLQAHEVHSRNQNPDEVEILQNSRATRIGFVQYRDFAILQAGYHQATPTEFPFGGSQCCGMSAVCIAYAFLQTPITWTTQVLNSVLQRGNSYYRSIALENEFLSSDQIGGEILCFDVRNVRVEPLPHEYRGVLNKVPGLHLRRLNESLEELLNSDYSAAIITIGDYCMAIIKTDAYVYLFDSHARGMKGGKASNARGRACLLKYERNSAARLMSQILHRNCQPGYNFDPTAILQHHLQFQYEIRPIRCTDMDEQQQNEDNNIVSSLHDNNNNNITQNAEASSSTTQRSDANFIQEATSNHIMLDSVIRSDEYAPPDLDKFKEQCRRNENAYDANKMLLNRERGAPLYPEKEERLEELAFIKMFPYGRNGYSERRRIPITPLDYFQQRIMGENKIFHTNEYLFYALYRTELHMLNQKIAVCGNMRRQQNENGEGNGIVNEHLLASGLRGTPSYWKKYTGDVLAMIEQNAHGDPTFFLTISYDDLNSRDVLTALWKSEYGAEAELPHEYMDIPFEERKNLLNQNPVASSRHFAHKMNIIMNLLQKQDMYLFGRKLVDYTYRVEFQGRGSPHVHMILWLADVPEWNTSEGIAFLEANISCSLSIPFAEIVRRYQTHRHSATCFKNSQLRCRFAFPRTPSESTRILDEEEIQKNKGRFVELKRTEEEVYINNYHPKLLNLIRCNIDIQAITGARSIAYYIGKYISKAEPTEIRKEVRDSIKLIQENTQLSYYAKAKKIASIIMHHREITAPEAGMRMTHVCLRRSSRICIFLPTFMPNERIRLVRKETLSENETPLFGMNIIDRYSYRPNTLKQLCLLEFAAHYAPKRNEARKQVDKDLIEGSDDEAEDCDYDEQEKPTTKFINLKSRKGQVFRRPRHAVVKHPFFKPTEQKDKYLYSMMLLYYPFEQESDIMQGSYSIQNAFERLRPHFRTSLDDPIIKPELAEELANAMVMIEAEIIEENDENNGEQDQHNMFFEEDVMEVNENEIFIPIAPPNGLADIGLIERRDRLITEQRNIFDKVLHNVMNPNAPQLLQFVQGCGGTGKSFLITALTMLIQSLSPAKERALIKAAPTGVAARNINAVTLHKAFSLGVEKDGIAAFMDLGGLKLQERKRLFRDLKWIILDEVSMISYQTLRMIHKRLCQIFGNNEMFGGMNVLLLGDVLQLPPIRGNWCFDRPACWNHEEHLWDQFQFCELTAVMRQQNRDAFYDLLMKLRVGTLTKPDLQVLHPRILEPMNYNYKQLLPFSEQTVHLYPRVKQVDEYNGKKMEEMNSKGSRVYVMEAVDSHASGLKYGRRAENDFIPKDDRKCAGIARKLELCVNAKVMLKWNIDVLGGLCNGSIGTVRGFVWTALRSDQRETGDLPQSVVVEFDQPVHEQHLYRQEGFQNCVEISPRDFEYKGNRNAMLYRRQVPLVLSYAITIHKSQGMTMNQATVYLGSKIFKPGQLYVCLSRITSIEGVFVTEMDERKFLVNGKGKDPCDELPLRHLYFTKLTKICGIKDEEELNEILNWILEYPFCRRCTLWTCMCICSRG